jgi:hypothetical protein
VTNEERLAAAKAKAAELQAEIAQVRAELAKESKPWEPWKPAYMQVYWYLSSVGEPMPANWHEVFPHMRRRDINNCFPTKEAAERHALRLRSMRPTCPVPKVGDTVYSLAFDDSPQPSYMKHTWRGRTLDHYYYNRGVVFASIEAFDAWVEEFGDAWTTLEDEA